MSKCQRCDEHEARLCVSCANELQDTAAQDSPEVAALVEACEEAIRFWRNAVYPPMEPIEAALAQLRKEAADD